MTEHEDIFKDSIESLECPGVKTPHQSIPPISSFARQGGEVTDGEFGSTGSNLFDSTSDRNHDAGNSLASNNEAFTDNQNNRPPSVIVVAEQLLGSVANFVSSTPESIVSSQSTVWSLPTAPVTVSDGNQAAHNSIMAVQSPQLHAALTMNSLSTSNVSLHDAYSSIMQQQGINNSQQHQQQQEQTNFVPFTSTSLPIGIHTSHMPMNAPQTPIEVTNVRSEIEKLQHHHTIGPRSTGKVINEMDKQPTRVLNAVSANHQVMPVSLIGDQASFMNSSLPTAATIAPPNTQLLPVSSSHPHEENAAIMSIRSDGNGAPSMEQPIPVGIPDDISDQETEGQVGTDSNRRRSKKGKRRTVPSDEKDDRYFERRKRNNQAAKRSRDARKVREEHVSRRADFLERENAILKAQLSTLREEANSLRQLLSQRPVMPPPMLANHGHQMT